ncbi:MAG: hypothetical protein A2X80_01150 [Geobacteraceae bacterium GWB2_52_12]|nr:MAG: hypothetical protein A2X80_01150 [Geobacteraceae bacterium GWB2_52_12]
MAVRELTLTKGVAGLFLIFYVLVPIARMALHSGNPEPSGHARSCSGCLGAKQQVTSKPEQYAVIECRTPCIQKGAPARSNTL